MSSHKRSFQCFSAVPASHKHVGCRLPRTPDPDAAEAAACYLWSQCRHARAVEAFRSQATPLCPYHRHQHRRPSRPDEPPPRAKKVVLIKNSEPSLRKTVVLQRKGLRSLGLFLEEVSELLQYHVRRLYTLDGHKVENVQSIIQCPSVLVCVGREPSHPSILERFRRTAEDKLPKLTAKARLTGNEGQTVQPKLTSANRSTRHSVSSEKSLPDGTESPDGAGSVSPTADGTLDDNVEKQVRINKDGSLSMKMKVRFRLDNDETLLWSTEVTKSTNKASEFPQELDSVGSCSGSEIFSASEPVEAYVTRRRHRHAQCSRYPHCYNIWTNGPGPRGDSCGVQTSSSSASSRTLVSRKTVAQRSSEENAEHVVEQETCVEASETVEYCTIRAGSCAMENSEPKEQPGSAVSGDDASPSATRPSSHSGKPVQDEATEGAEPDTSGKSSSGSSDAKRSGTVKQSKKSYACYCGTSKDDTEASSEETGKVERPQSSTSVKPNVSPNAEPEGGEEEGYKSAMSAHSNASTKCKADVFEADDRPPSQTSVTSEVKSEQCQPEKEAAEERPPTSLSSKSKTSVTSRGSAGGDEENAPEEHAKEKDHGEQSETGAGLRTQSQTSVSKAPPLSVFDRSKVDSQEESKSTEEAQDRAPSVRSSVSNASAGMQERSASAVSATSGKSKISDADVMSRGVSFHVDSGSEEVPQARASSSMSVVSTTSDVRSRQSKSPPVGVGEDTTEAAEDRPQSAIQSVNMTSDRQSKLSKATDGGLDNECKSEAGSSIPCHLEDGVQEAPSSDQVEGNPANRSESEARSHSAMSGKTGQSESSAMATQSKDSEANGSNEEIAERAESVISAKSRASNRSSQAETSQRGPVGEEANQRSPSATSVQSAKSSLSSRSNEHEREPSVKSAISAKSTQSAKSSAPKAGKVPAESKDASAESNHPNTPPNGVDTNERAMSTTSARCHISARSSKSKCSADVPAQDESRCSEDEENKHTEKRPSSCTSATSTLSHVSAERSPSALSVKSHVSRKSARANLSEVSASKRLPNENLREECDERAQSAASAKTAMSTPPVTSTEPKGDDDARDHEERALSERSARSAKSHISAPAGSVKDGVSDRGADSSLEEDGGSISLTSLSMKSSKSARSGRSKCSVEVRRPKSDASETSHVSELVTEHVSSRAGSKLSAKSAKSNQSKVSAEENARRRDSTERALSNSSIRSAKSTSVSGASRGVSELMSEHSIEIADVESEELISSEQSVASAMKKDSILDGPAEDTSQCADHDENRQQPEEGPAHSQACGVIEDVSECCMTSGRAASSLSAKSAMSASCSAKSKTSVHSLLYTANETESEHHDDSDERSASGASAKSTRTNGSESPRSIAACEVPSEENAVKEEETTPRPPSAVTAKSTRSAKSAHSVTSAKSKCSVAAQDNNDEIIESAVSSTSGKSDQSRRSKSSAATNKSKATGDAANTDEIERRAKSVVSLLSGGPKSSLRPQNECGEDECEEGRSQSATTNLSDTTFKSRSSNICNGGRVEGVQGTPAALSVKSNQSSRSRTSVKGSSEPNEGTDERSKSATSSVSAKSTKSDLPVVTIEESEHGARTAVRSKSQASATSEALEKKSKESAHSGKSKKRDLLVAKDHDKQAKAVPQSGETSVHGDVSCEHVPNGPKDATDAGTSDNKSDTQTVDGDDDEALVPSSLPNASLTEVVNEWLNKIPPDGELFDMEELSGNVLHDTNGNTVSENNLNGLNEEAGVSDGEQCHETAGEKGANHPRDADSEIFHSSVLVMKVLLNPKLDRCSSLPEVSPSYGRKLSTSATSLIDCLAKLQLIDTNPTSADEKSERYKALVEGLQSLWLCDPAKNEPVLEEKADRHSDKDFNQGSSSGIDVNSGSTGSGKSSGGRKQQQTLEVTRGKAQEVPQQEGAAGGEEEQMREESPKGDASTNETIRSNDSPRVLCDSPHSSDEISGRPRQSCKQRSHDPDPVWVLSLLTKIEKQFMTHYVNATCEFRNQWNVDDHEQLDGMISELKDEIHRRIQTSINRELRKIEGRAGLPRPPKEAKSRPSTTQTDERRQRLRMKTKPAGKSDDSATSTIFSDQRGEIEDDNCPCESCLRKKMSLGPQRPAEVTNSAPVLMEFDLQRILRMRNDHRMQDSLANSETKAAAARLVGQILDHAVREAVEDGDMEDAFAVLECKNQAENRVEEARTENAPSQEDSECEVSGGDAEANAAEDADEAKESTRADSSHDEPEEDGAVDMASQTPATGGDESDHASTAKHSNELTAENALITEVAAEDEGAAQEPAVAVTSRQESEEAEGRGVDGGEEPPAASGEENDKPATGNQSNDDESGDGGRKDGEGPETATFEDEYAPQDATIAASDDNKTQEDEEARESEENGEASTLKNSNEDANTVDEVSADDGGEDEDAALVVTTRAATEHESEAEEELAGEDQDETPAPSADENDEEVDEEVPKTVEDATQEAAGSAASGQESEEDEEGGVESGEETPATSGAENEDAAEVEVMSEEVSGSATDEAAAQATDSNKEEPEGEEETLATSAAENEDVADTEQPAEGDDSLRENVADTTAAENAAQAASGSAASGQESAEEFDEKVDAEEETCATSGAENEDAATDDQAAAIDGMMTDGFPEMVKDEDAQEAATSDPESEKHKEPKVGGEEETPVTSGDENEDEDEDGADADRDAEEDDVLSENDAGTAAAEEAAQEATVSATSGEQSEEEEEGKVDGEEETPAPSGGENEDGGAADQDASIGGLTTEDLSETVKGDNAEEAAMSGPESEEEKEPTVGGEEETPATSADENRGTASTEDGDEDSATAKDQTNVQTKKEDLEESQQEHVDDNENSVEEDPAPTSDGGEDAAEAPDDEDASDKARGEDVTAANASEREEDEAADRAEDDGGEEGEVATQEEDEDADRESALSAEENIAEDQDAMVKESEFEGPEAQPEECFQKDQVEAAAGDSAEATGEGCDEGEDGSNDAQAAEGDPASREDDEKAEPVVTNNKGTEDTSGAEKDERNEMGDHGSHSRDEHETNAETTEAAQKEEEEPEVITEAASDDAMDPSAQNNQMRDGDGGEDDEEEPAVTDDEDPDEAVEPRKENKESKDACNEEQPQDDDRETNGETFEASEKEEQGPEPTGQGESADGEDGADSDDDEDQEEKSQARDFIPAPGGEAASQKADNGVLSERTTLRVKTALRKASAESEGGIEADGEDSDA